MLEKILSPLTPPLRTEERYALMIVTKFWDENHFSPTVQEIFDHPLAKDGENNVFENIHAVKRAISRLASRKILENDSSKVRTITIPGYYHVAIAGEVDGSGSIQTEEVDYLYRGWLPAISPDTEPFKISFDSPQQKKLYIPYRFGVCLTEKFGVGLPGDTLVFCSVPTAFDAPSGSVVAATLPQYGDFVGRMRYPKRTSGQRSRSLKVTLDVGSGVGDALSKFPEEKELKDTETVEVGLNRVRIHGCLKGFYRAY